MKSSNYKCRNEECGNIQEIFIKLKDNFPKSIVCSKCYTHSKRIFTPLHSIIHQGKCGNYKNGYTSNSTNIKKT